MESRRSLGCGLVVALLVYCVAAWIFGTAAVQDAIRAVAAVLSCAVVFVYGKYALRSLTANKPKPEDFVIVGITCVSAGYSFLWSWRIVSIELGVQNWFIESPIIGIAAMVVLYGLLCHLTVVKRWRYDPEAPLNWRLVWFVLGVGSLLALVLALRAIY